MNSLAKVKSLVMAAVLLAAAARIFAMRQQDSAELMLVKVEANAGNPEAQFLLGLRYGFGDGVREDPARAESWLRVAAESGLVEAQSALGELYLLSGPEYAHEAEKWLTVAADKGDGQSTALLASLSAKGLLDDQPQSQKVLAKEPSSERLELARSATDQADIVLAESGSKVEMARANSPEASGESSIAPSARKPPLTLMPGRDMPFKPYAPAAAQPEGGFPTGWRTWILGAIAVATLSSLFLGRRS
ncbi:MAG: hypothetical protein WDM96_19770 [Lacunisphaera sp.]